MIHVPALWKRPDLQFPQPFDTIFFDVDGVLIETTASFLTTNIIVTEYIVGTLLGLDWGQDEGKKLLTLQDIEAFKQAGGYNSDWNMCYLLVALFTARLREWRGTSLAERSIQEWADLSRAANLQGHGGNKWTETAMPASALLDYQLIVDIYNECYWGATGLLKRFGRPARYMPDAPGLANTEALLFAPDLPTRLRAAGIKHMGIITGRVGPEVDSVVERFLEHSGEQWWEVIVPANVYAKPDPRAIRLAIDTVGARGGLFIGDTADDYDLIRLYQSEKASHEPDMLMAMLIKEAEDEIYKKRGADFIVRSVEDLFRFLPEQVVS